MLKVSVTGQRPKTLDNDYTYQSDLWKFIYEELEATFLKINPPKIYVGGALGVDTVAAEVALKLNIPYVLCKPFIGQEDSWGPEQQRHYNELADYAQSVVVLGTKDQLPWIYQKRNEYMVDNSDIVVAVWNGFKGGTRNCVEYALKQKQTVWRIDPTTRKVGRYDGSKIIQKQSLSLQTVPS
jgi:uncharacterized phage-like protein YoqJ